MPHFCVDWVSLRFSQSTNIYTWCTLSIARGLSRSHIQASVNDRAPLTALFNWINKWRTLHTCNASSHASMIKHSNVFALTLNCFDWNHINTHLNSWNTFFSRQYFECLKWWNHLSSLRYGLEWTTAICIIARRTRNHLYLSNFWFFNQFGISLFEFLYLLLWQLFHWFFQILSRISPNWSVQEKVLISQEKMPSKCVTRV